MIFIVPRRARPSSSRHLSAEERQQRAAELVRGIERQTRERLRRDGKSPMGRRRIERQDPHAAPLHPSSSPAPRFHARCPEIRKGLELDFYHFRICYRQAAEQLRAGRADAEFPHGCFPPRLPFYVGRPPPVPSGSDAAAG